MELPDPMNYEALYKEDASEAEQIECYQRLINSGQAWRLEGHVGRTAMSLIEAGQCLLGLNGHRDYWGNYVPSRTQVKAGTKGSFDYVVERAGEEHAKAMQDLT